MKHWTEKNFYQQRAIKRGVLFTLFILMTALGGYIGWRLKQNALAAYMGAVIPWVIIWFLYLMWKLTKDIIE